ncbi:MAG: hypothetical protein IIA72_12745 [Proteobacteria bacterium]|nr:hypothetical protein [Pseudomonadota bacterium]
MEPTAEPGLIAIGVIGAGCEDTQRDFLDLHQRAFLVVEFVLIDIAEQVGKSVTKNFEGSENRRVALPLEFDELSAAIL